MTRADVLVTGLGTVSCLGDGVAAFWKGLHGPALGPSRITDPDAHFAVPYLYSVEPAVADALDAPQEGLPAASRFAVAAAREAFRDAGLERGTVRPGGVVLGTALGDFGPREQWRQGPDSYPGAVGPAEAVAADLGGTGETITIANACAASGYAISAAADLIASGAADVVVTGGAEGYSRVALACFNRLGAVDPVRCRPFDRARRGTVFGEGAGILVLESAEHAARRGAHAYARLAGSGWSCDAHHLTAPEPQGTQIVRAMRQAFDAAGLTPSDIGCVVPHGTGTELNDVVESQVLTSLLGDRVATVPVHSLKARVGHTGGAAASLAVLAAALIIERETVPPNAPLDEQDPDCGVWLPDTEPLPLTGPGVLVNAYAFGGNNASLVLTRAAA